MPVQYPGVMVSSTFTDLVDHRAALITAIESQKMKALGMEHDAARPVDVITSSLEKVAEAAAYVGIISHKYGQVPECPRRNPKGLSLTELELNEARRLGLPILLFIMSDEHFVKKVDVEKDPEKEKKLIAFRESAKRASEGSSVHLVYKVFDNLDEFRVAAMQSAAELRRFIDAQTAKPAPMAQSSSSLPFRAEPPYIGSHQFVGRKAQLEVLSHWAAATDKHPVLLFDAIGGSGKSMLTWEWTTQTSTSVRTDWAGRFWYSFYEKGSVMADFCRRALAYMKEEPYEGFRGKKTTELMDDLLEQLRRRPWLLVLDGFERVLVAYQRHDAAQITDEEASAATDQIADRDPCSAIRWEDDQLLRMLAAASPSKLLITSRLVPRVLLNRAGSPIAGVRREVLPGLEPEDAEALIRSCGVEGTSARIRTYLDVHCDCHPLVVGIVAGLVNDYMPNRGNFDAWADDPAEGGHLDIADLDLVQKRNHILHAALAALPEKRRNLLATLALLPDTVDYETLVALNPHIPPPPEFVPEPMKVPDYPWRTRTELEELQRQQAYDERLKVWKKYQEDLNAWKESDEVRDAPKKLAETVRDLEARGLLQYDAQSRRYDLHPVVRGVAAGGLKADEKVRYGQQVIDHFSQKSHDPYRKAETLDELRTGLHIVRTFLQMGRKGQAYAAYTGELSDALFFNLEAHAEVLSLLKAFFPERWDKWPTDISDGDAADLANDVAFALKQVGELKESMRAYEGLLRAVPRREDWRKIWVYLVGIAKALEPQNQLAKEERCLNLARDFALLEASPDAVFATGVHCFQQLSRRGAFTKAEALWNTFDKMGRNFSRAYYRQGTAEHRYAQAQFWRGKLKEKHLDTAEKIANAEKNRAVLREVHALRGEWHLENVEWSLAVESLTHAVRMARETAQPDVRAEAQLALAKFRINQLPDPVAYAEHLSHTTESAAQLPIAQLWHALGDHSRAQEHAHAAYEWAWADGAPYVRRHELTRSGSLLEALGAKIPTLPPYSSDSALDWENQMKTALEKRRMSRKQFR